MQNMKNGKRVITLNAIGKDRLGIVENFSSWFRKHKANITECDSYTVTTVTPTLFATHLKAEINRNNGEEIKRKLGELCSEIGMKRKITLEGERKIKKVFLLTTTEKHCTEAILKHQSDLPVEVIGIIGTNKVIEPLAKEYKVSFDLVDIPDRIKHDRKMFEIIEKKNPDFIVLPRYVRKIMDIEFLCLYKNLIINVHPSLLPSFPGAMAYGQAYDAHVDLHGSTTHLINEKMDQGPMLWQEPYSILPNENSNSLNKRGKKIEIISLLIAIHLFANEIITVVKDVKMYKDGGYILSPERPQFENFLIRCFGKDVADAIISRIRLKL